MNYDSSPEYVLQILYYPSLFCNLRIIHTDNLFADEFAVGENYIRISNAGGPDFNNQNIYYLLQDSDYIEYKITLDENGILSSLIRLS